MRYVKFVMSRGKDITVDEQQAKEILRDERQMCPVVDPKTGEWTRESINKAHLVETVPDHEKDRAMALQEQSKRMKLEMPEISEEQRKANRKKLQEMRKNLFDRKIIS